MPSLAPVFIAAEKQAATRPVSRQIKTSRVMRSRLIALLAAFASPLSHTWAQSEQTDFLRQTGMIYVVVAVMAVIFVGIGIFLLYIDRKLTKLENQISDHDQNG